MMRVDFVDGIGSNAGHSSEFIDILWMECQAEGDFYVTGRGDEDRNRTGSCRLLILILGLLFIACVAVLRTLRLPLLAREFP